MLYTNTIPKQAMILAAGEGTRMRPLTLTTPKPLLLVHNKPLIVWHIERLINIGITNIVINARYLAEQLVDFFAQHTFGATITLSLETDFARPIETAGGIKWALQQGLLYDAPFLLINGDVWTDFDLSILANKALNDNLGCLGLVDNPSHHPQGDFSLCGQKITAGEPKWTFSGLSLLTPALVSIVKIGEKAPLAPLLHAAIAQDKLLGCMLQNAHWVDVGTPERLAQLNQYLVDKY